MSTTLTDHQLEEIALFTQVYQVSLGNVIGGKVSKEDSNPSALVSPFPCTLYPTSIKREVWTNSISKPLSSSTNFATVSPETMQFPPISPQRRWSSR